MQDERDNATGTRLARRSVVGAAWAAPVILTAAAAPAAVASTGGFDVALDPPQLGGSTTVFDGDFTRIYSVDDPIAWVVANHGTEPAPGGFPMSVTCDNRVWKIRSVKGGLDQKRANLPITQRVSNGNSTTVTFTIPDDIPPNTDSYSGFWVSLTKDFVARYPDDGISPAPTVTRWEVTPPAGDTNGADDVVEFAGYKDEGPADIWGAIVTRVAQETVQWADGTPLNRPTKVKVTSAGPKPTLDGSAIHLGTDARMSTDISVTHVQVDGVPSTILSKGETSVWQDSGLQVQFNLTRGLTAGQVLTFDITYVDQKQAAPVEPSPGQTNFNPPDAELNEPNERAKDRSYFNN